MTWQDANPIITGIFTLAVAVFTVVTTKASRRAQLHAEHYARVRDEVRVKAVAYVEGFLEKIDRLDMSLHNLQWYHVRRMDVLDALKTIAARVDLQSSLFGSKLYIESDVLATVATILPQTEDVQFDRIDDLRRRISEASSIIASKCRQEYFLPRATEKEA